MAASSTTIAWVLLAAAAAVSLTVLVRTRWLQSHTLAKCVALSVALHALLAVICAFVGAAWGPAALGPIDHGQTTMIVALDDDAEVMPADADADPRPDEPPATRAASGSNAAGEVPPLVPLLAGSATSPDEPADRVPLLELPEPAAADLSGETAAGPVPQVPQPTERHAVPDIYADRIGPRRAAAAAAHGGSPGTEEAVAGALAWLAGAQSPDGTWNAARHGGGVERSVQGHHRHGAGARSDHGVTGLALLAMLGAGNTHRSGAYAAHVARGLNALCERQRPDGSLAGDAEFFAALYCHGMATIAVAECCALTGDESLRPALDRAVGHTLATQHPQTGGWRYAAGDRGDTSQLGWQVMVLASARSAGLDGFEPAEGRARRYLESVSAGQAGGLASYRPGERPSLAMTAEALYCRLILGMSPTEPAAAEALAMLATSPPTTSQYNSYTWYYATLASFHAGGTQWDRWNRTLQATLLPLQRREPPPLAGSFDPDPVWGGHGGRVYATALSAMTLEVYYRHRPMHERHGRPATLPTSAER